MKKLIEVTDDLIENLLNELDFGKIEIAMEALRWTYGDSELTPSKTELRRCANDRLQNLKKENVSGSHSGGFEAFRNEFNVGIRFVVDSVLLPDNE